MNADEMKDETEERDERSTAERLFVPDNPLPGTAVIATGVPLAADDEADDEEEDAEDDDDDDLDD